MSCLNQEFEDTQHSMISWFWVWVG